MWASSAAVNDGEMGWRRVTPPFSRRITVHSRGSRSIGRRLSTPPRRHAVSMHNRKTRESRAGSLLVVVAASWISAIWIADNANRRLGLATG